MRILFLAALVAAAAPAQAELREFCASRPGLGTPPCTVDPGHVVVEVGALDWTLERTADERNDSFLLGDTLVRVGLDDRTEVQLGWTPYGVVRTRDLATGTVSRAGGIGDVTLALRRSLSGPDGPVAVQPFVTLPTGGAAIGGGDWGAGIIVPMAFDLGHGVEVALSPEIDAAVNESGSGRHLAFGSVIGVSAPLTDALTATAELQAMRDQDPAGRTTQSYASVSLAWLTGRDTQFDVGAVAGLNRDSADVELYFGVARRF